MKALLLDLLSRVTPSRTIINNCLELVQREQVGLTKYGTSLEDSGLSHEQLLQHAREEMLDGANYLEAALHTARQAHVDHASLLGLLNKELQEIDTRLTVAHYADYHAGLAMMRDRLRTLLIDHEEERTIRALRKP